MERQENIRPHNLLEEEYSKSKIFVSIIILFHIVGLAGLSIPSTRSLFLYIIPFHLLLMLAVVVINHNYVDGRFLFFVLIVFVSGFTAEWIGVHKHWLFGDYSYGKTLGFQVLDVPLIIGLNWFLLTYSTGVLMDRSRLKSMFFRIITGALLLVLLDILIEAMAIRLDYWHWANNAVPVKNYICWFLLSAFMLLIFELFRFKKQSIVAPVLLLTEFIFFGLLCLLAVCHLS
jgi:bisanhydrobacterioruberin hydratase